MVFFGYCFIFVACVAWSVDVCDGVMHCRDPGHPPPMFAPRISWMLDSILEEITSPSVDSGSTSALHSPHLAGVGNSRVYPRFHPTPVG